MQGIQTCTNAGKPRLHSAKGSLQSLQLRLSPASFPSHQIFHFSLSVLTPSHLPTYTRYSACFLPQSRWQASFFLTELINLHPLFWDAYKDIKISPSPTCSAFSYVFSSLVLLDCIAFGEETVFCLTWKHAVSATQMNSTLSNQN